MEFVLVGGGISVLCGFAYRKYMAAKWGEHDTTDEQNVQGKVVIITGANEGLGKETAFEMYKRGATVIMACRNMETARVAADEIRQRVPGTKGQLIVMKLDLSSFESIRQFATDFQEKFDHVNILINNAGVYMPYQKESDLQKTVDGNEIHFQVNYLSHFLLTILLVEQCKRGDPCRIVNVASSLYEKARLTLEDVNLENLEPSSKTKMVPYANSKLANVLFSRELATRIQGNGIFTYAVCPGWVKTSIFRNSDLEWYHYILFAPIAFLFMRSVHQGCQTILQCALSNERGTETGKLYRNCELWASSSIVTDPFAKKLWDLSEKLVDEKLRAEI